MKTKLSTKSDLFERNNIEVLTENEMKELYGGLRMITVIDEDGNIKVIILP